MSGRARLAILSGAPFGAASIVASVAVGCATIAGIDEFHETRSVTDASVDATSIVNADGAPGCSGFMCGTQCVPFGDPTFGCSPENSCRPCPTGPNLVASCVNNVCTAECAPGFLNCNGDLGDGCEVDPKTNRHNCSACGVACNNPELPDCIDGQCVIECPAGTNYCAGDCFTLLTSTQHCGNCATTCPTAGLNSRAQIVCALGQCVAKCTNGSYGDCDGNLVNGCETVIKGSDVNHCGSCSACAAASNSTAKCQNGSCKTTCTSGFADCDGSYANGCECSLATNNCDGTSCVGPCKPIDAPCSKSSDCCGATAGTATCATDIDGNPTNCAAL